MTQGPCIVIFEIITVLLCSCYRNHCFILYSLAILLLAPLLFPALVDRLTINGYNLSKVTLDSSPNIEGCNFEDQ